MALRTGFDASKSTLAMSPRLVGGVVDAAEELLEEPLGPATVMQDSVDPADSIEEARAIAAVFLEVMSWLW